MSNTETIKRKLIKKYFIRGSIKTLTGLHIGGTKTTLDIGGVDLNVIKTAKGVPYIPGSSLKGKLRTMLARIEGSPEVNKDSKEIKRIFGGPDESDNNKKGYVTRILVRDAFLNVKKFTDGLSSDLLEFDFSGIKVENTINRKEGTALHPRQIERVPAGAEFDFEIVYDGYEVDGSENQIDEDIKMMKKAMLMLQDDYIGGNGSRGYGKIEFLIDESKCKVKAINNFDNETKLILNDEKYGKGNFKMLTK